MNFGRIRRHIWVYYFWKHRWFADNCDNGYSIRYWIDRWLYGSQGLKDRDHCWNYIGYC